MATAAARNSITGYRPPGRRRTASTRGARWISLGVVIALHALVLAAALSHAPTRAALADAAPVLVRFIQPEPPRPATPPAPRPEPEKPKPTVKPRPVQPRAEPPPIIAAASPAPSAFEAPAAPAKVEPAPAAAPVGPVAAAAPAPVIPPSFNADYLQNPAPAYPALSRRLGEEGRVVLRVYVDPDGHPARVEMRTSSGHSRLDEVALETVRKWKFVPAKQGAQPVAAWVLVPISFSLRG
jgi:protein TonB